MEVSLVNGYLGEAGNPKSKWCPGHIINVKVNGYEINVFTIYIDTLPLVKNWQVVQKRNILLPTRKLQYLWPVPSFSQNNNQRLLQMANKPLQIQILPSGRKLTLVTERCRQMWIKLMRRRLLSLQRCKPVGSQIC